MMDFGWILIDAIDLTLVDKMDFGGIWLIWGLFHVVSNVLKLLPVFLPGIGKRRLWVPQCFLLHRSSQRQMMSGWGQIAETGFSVWRQTVAINVMLFWTCSEMDATNMFQLLLSGHISWWFPGDFYKDSIPWAVPILQLNALQVSHGMVPMVPRSLSIWHVPARISLALETNWNMSRHQKAIMPFWKSKIIIGTAFVSPKNQFPFPKTSV